MLLCWQVALAELDGHESEEYPIVNIIIYAMAVGARLRPGAMSLFDADLSLKNTSSRHPGLALGSVFLSLFGAAWLSGASYLYVGTSVPVLSVIAIISLLIAAWAVTTFRARRSEYSGENNSAVRKGLISVNILQWAAISIAILLLNLTHHAAWIVPCVIFIVGVHFFPLAKILQYRCYYLTATSLVLVALLYMLFGGEGQSLALAMLATGAILWASAIALLFAV
jgi:hypothetical protein